MGKYISDKTASIRNRRTYIVIHDNSENKIFQREYE